MKATSTKLAGRGVRPAIVVEFGGGVAHVYALVDGTQWSDAGEARAVAQKLADELLAGALVTLVKNGYRAVERVAGSEVAPMPYMPAPPLPKARARAIIKAAAKAQGKTHVITYDGAVFFHGPSGRERMHGDMLQFAAELLAKR